MRDSMREESMRTSENVNSSHRGLSACDYVLIIISSLLVLVTFPLTIWFCIKMVNEYERAVIFRLGRIVSGRAKGPGIFFVLPCTDTMRKMDLRTISFQIPPQEILTRDSVTVSVDAVVYYRIVEPTMAVVSVENADASTKLLAMTTLRNALGIKTLSEILTDREEMADRMENILLEATRPWGIRVERVELKDVRLPLELQRAMAAEAEATREARAKVAAAEGEVQASRALREAAQVISEAPSALQLRYLQTLNQIAAESNSTIVFPLPMELLSAFSR
uniref:Zgc:112408 n=1 Tax=Eptatretus burgeri TaxID=7764 RepID=A0A8C4NC32_EPTBU